MDEMVRYIFGNMKSYEVSMKNVKRTLRAQARTNAWLGIFALTTTACLIVAEVKRIELEEKVMALNEKIEELKGVEGV